MLAELAFQPLAVDFNWTMERRIVDRTWGRIRQLRVEATQERVVVRGSAPSYYLKQLALAAISEILAAAYINPVVEVDIQVGPSGAGLAADHARKWEPSSRTGSEDTDGDEQSTP